MFRMSMKRQGSDSAMGKVKDEHSTRTRSERSSTRMSDRSSSKRGSGRASRFASHSPGPRKSNTAPRMSTRLDKLRSKKDTPEVVGDADPSSSPPAPPKEGLFGGRKLGSMSISPRAPKRGVSPKRGGSLRIFRRSYESGKSPKSSKQKEKQKPKSFSNGMDDEDVEKTPSKSSRKSRFSFKPAYFTAPVDRSDKKVKASSLHNRGGGLSFVPNLGVDEEGTYELEDILETPKQKGRSKKRSSRRVPPSHAPELSPHQASPGTYQTSPGTYSAKQALNTSLHRSPSPYSLNRHSMSHTMRSESLPRNSISMRSMRSTPSHSVPPRSRRQEKLDAQREASEEFTVGQLVELHSLSNEAMNGRKGRVYGKKENADRYHIALFAPGTPILKSSAPPLEDEQDYVAIRPRNLKVISWEEAEAGTVVAENEASVAEEESTKKTKKKKKKKKVKKKKTDKENLGNENNESAAEETSNTKKKKKKKKKKVPEKKQPSQISEFSAPLGGPLNEVLAADEPIPVVPKPDYTRTMSGRSVFSSKTSHIRTDVTVDDFEVGEWVQLTGLRTESMNGREGYVYGKGEDRIHVVIDQVGDVDLNLKNFMQDQDYVAIRPQNLVPLGGGNNKQTTPQNHLSSPKNSDKKPVSSSNFSNSQTAFSMVSMNSTSDWDETDDDDSNRRSFSHNSKHSISSPKRKEKLYNSSVNLSNSQAEFSMVSMNSNSDWEDTDDDGSHIPKSVSRRFSQNGASKLETVHSRGRVDTSDEEEELVDDEESKMKSMHQNKLGPVVAPFGMDTSSDEDEVMISDSDSDGNDQEIFDKDEEDDDDSYEIDTDAEESSYETASENSSYGLDRISELSKFEDPKVTPPNSYQKKNSFNKEADATSSTVDETQEGEEEEQIEDDDSVSLVFGELNDVGGSKKMKKEESDAEESIDINDINFDDLKEEGGSTSKRDENEKSEVLDWYHCSRMIDTVMSDQENTLMSSDSDDSDNDSLDEDSKMLSLGDDDQLGELVAQPKRRKSAQMIGASSSIKQNHYSLTSALENVKAAIEYEEMLRDLKKKGLSREIICDSDDESESSDLTMTDNSYIMDLRSQMYQRNALRQEELLEMAYDLFSRLASSKESKFNGQSEELFLKIHEQVTTKHGPELKARDDAKDRRLRHYLAAVENKKY